MIRSIKNWLNWNGNLQLRGKKLKIVGKDKGDIGDEKIYEILILDKAYMMRMFNNTSNINNTASTAKKVQVQAQAQARIIQSSSDKKVKSKTRQKKIKTDSSQNDDGTCDDPYFRSSFNIKHFY